MVLVDYIRLTRPRITLLVILTGFIGMWTASRGALDPFGVLWFLAALSLASSGAAVFNSYYDRDIDCLMKRTSKRPLAQGRLKPSHALIFGIALTLISFALFLIFFNLLSAILAALTTFCYSYVYTVLKRKTPKATEIGGISGALPPVIGWAAARGTLNLEALVLFAIMFLWQPPHFWALGLHYKEDYRKAKIPTMSVVYSENDTTVRSLIYVLCLLSVSVMPYFLGMTGSIYLITSSFLGILYVLLYGLALMTKRDLNRTLFFYSIVYLSLVFIAMVFDLKR